MPKPINDRRTTRREKKTDARPATDANLEPNESPAVATTDQPSQDAHGDTHEEPFRPVQLGSAFDEENAEAGASDGASGMAISKPGEGECNKTWWQPQPEKEIYIAQIGLGRLRRKDQV
jgi:hypothetical protein